MSSSEIQIPYQTPLIKMARLARGLGTTARALWIAYAIFVAAVVLAGLATGLKTANPLLETMSKSLGLSDWSLFFLLTALFLFLAFTCELIEKALFPIVTGAQIGLTDDLILLPISAALSAKFQLQRRWSDIGGLSIARDRLVVNFKSKGSAELALNLLPAHQRDLLLLYCDIKCGSGQRDATFEAAMNEIGSDEPGKKSLINIWQESVSRRFRPLNFAPLRPDSTLCDGELIIRRLISSNDFTANYVGQQADAALFLIKEIVVPEEYAKAAKSAREAMRREVESGLPKDSAHVLPAVRYFTENNRDYIVYEYPTGESLQDIVRQSGTLDSVSVLRWALQINECLRALRQCSSPIFHGSLSPDDLVLTDSVITLTDAGTANRFLTAAIGAFVGNRIYAAPEVLMGEVRPESDYFSLGQIMYFLLTGEEPEPVGRSQPDKTMPEVGRALFDNVLGLTVEWERRPSTPDQAKYVLEQDLAKLLSAPVQNE